jgi:hypothetical protein
MVQAHTQHRRKDMAHFARLDEYNSVVAVEVVANEVILDETGVESEELGVIFLTSLHNQTGWYKKTSYNSSFRKNFAAINGHYDPNKDAFISPKRYASWVLNETTCQWEAPVAYPDDDKMYNWDESTTNWKEVI